VNVPSPVWLAMPLGFAVLSTTASMQDPAPSADPRILHFESKVRPLLVSRCEECHAETAEGNLRVDSLAALLKGGDAGPAIVVGDPDASLLIQAIRHAGDLKMPKKRTRLAAEEIDAMAQWIRDGAVWPATTPTAASVVEQRIAENRDFWSFRRLELPAVPAVTDATWPRTDIDRFVLARLEAEGLRPVAAADRRTWLRRVTYDLTGLPPTAAETKAFVADASPEAENTVIDRLLATPAYSEHQARWWLDVARYAEDDCRSLDPEGRGFNPYPNAYLYRDWVIQAFADDLPFDQFLTAQLAADQLDEPERTRNLPALGFLGLGPWLYDNGSVEVTRADERHDRVDAVSRGMLGLTVACARCHDHKFDPISTEDYYSLAGVFLNTRYHEYPQVPKAVVDDWQRRNKRIENKSKLLAEANRLEMQQTAESLLLQTTQYMTAAWQVLGPPRRDKALVATQEKLDYELFDRWLVFLQKPPKHYGYLRAWQDMIERQGPKEEAKKLAAEFQTQLLDIMFAMKELKEENEIIRAKALPGTKKKERAKLPSDFVTNDDFCPGCGLELKSLPKEQANLWNDVFAYDLDGAFESENSEEARRKPGLFVFDGHALARQLSADRRRYLEDLKKDITAAKKELGPKFPFVHGVEDLPEPMPIKVHLRGSPFRLGEEVPRRFPAVLQSLPLQPFQKGSGRRELAANIVAHPLTARVFVNRVWKQHFGTGLVETPSDFGLKGERPSHPELLEHLATLFQAHGSLKELHRQILRSAVYGLGAFDNEQAQQKDASNRLYWRANERRLSAEQLRDSMLAVAGTLDAKPGGPSAKLTLKNRRRTIYGQVSRYSLDPYLALFDFPSPGSTSERRFVTNVAPQRLFLMNSDFVQEQAERTAERVAKAPGDAARIAQVYDLLFQREPTAAEVAAGLAYLQEEPMRQVEEHKAAAAKAAQEAPPPAFLPPPPPGLKTANQSSEAIVQPLAAPGKDGDKGDKDGEKDGDEEEEGAPGEKESNAEAPDPTKQPLPITIWGRYVKVLLCSNEFLFVR
jgi:hypothetical protein